MVFESGIFTCFESEELVHTVQFIASSIDFFGIRYFHAPNLPLIRWSMFLIQSDHTRLPYHDLCSLSLSLSSPSFSLFVCKCCENSFITNSYPIPRTSSSGTINHWRPWGKSHAPERNRGTCTFTHGQYHIYKWNRGACTSTRGLWSKSMGIPHRSVHDWRSSIW